ncbi:MAG: discoidin domain-containing protein [Verrucomicrobiota bacterium]|jgi:hypothetical protein
MQATRVWSRCRKLVLFALLFALGGPAVAGDALSLAGSWRFQLDRADAGIGERWFERSLSGTFTLPGSLPAAGIGDDISTNTPWTGGIVDRSWFNSPDFAQYRQTGNVKVPFWLQPEKYYAGVAWFQRDLDVPADWQGKRVVLFLERPHWETRVWVDNQLVGTNNSLSTPHEYDLGQLAPGQHTVSIRVDNRRIVDIGENSHAISDHTQGNWNGIVGKIELHATPLVWIEDAQAYPNVSNRAVRLVVKIGNATGKAGQGTLSFMQGVFSPSNPIRLLGNPVSWQTNGGIGEITFSPGPDAPHWDEFNLSLQKFSVILLSHETNAQNVDWRELTFGLREVATDGTQIVINGRKTFIRGTLECCIFPKTGHPPTDVAEWKRIIGVAKAHGLNLIRFHSYCPPEAAFIAADELGFYFQVETCWANGGAADIGDGRPVDQWVYDETDRILKAYGNHPSFLLMLYGNEPGGAHANEYLAKYVAHYRALDPRRLWSSGSGWPQLPENQFHVTPDPRIQSWGGGLKTRINAKPPETTTDYRDYIAARKVPVISHEIGQWCVYPNFDEIAKYTGYLKPKNFEIFRDTLNARHQGDLARSFLLASGKLQALCYKEDIESALRTPGMGGFELLDLHDFPGQGTALVGVLDPFWEEKGYVTAKEFRRFCNSTVPLARLKKRVFTTEENLDAEIEVAHFGADPIAGAVTTWKLVSDTGVVLAEGRLPSKDIPIGNGIPLGKVGVDLTNVKAPLRCKLVVSVGPASSLSPSPSSDRQDACPTFENDWDIWVYPPNIEPTNPRSVRVVEDLDEPALAALRRGGRVLWLIPRSRVRNAAKNPVALGFSSIFWNTAWTGRQPPTTLGILCDPKHPALAAFPTEYHSNWQWWYLISRAAPMILDDLPAALRPTVQVVDDWVTARKLALVFEARVGKGRLVVCSIDLQHDLEQNPVARQMRASLLRYLAGRHLAPAVEVTPDQLRRLTAPPSTLTQLGARVRHADSAEPGLGAENAIDGNPQTFWHTAWTTNATAFPHTLEIEFDRPARLRGLRLLPRQDGNPNGGVKDYAFYVSTDGQTWGEPVARGTFDKDDHLKTVQFATPCEARYIRLVALSGHANGPWAAVAELNVLLAQP